MFVTASVHKSFTAKRVSRVASRGVNPRHVSLRSGVYADSVRLMQVSREIGDRPGVTAVLVAMATPLNLELAAGMGLAPDGESKPDQLLIALTATDDTELTAAVAAVEAALAAPGEAVRTRRPSRQRTIGAGLVDATDPALAIISVPGRYAAAEAADAIAAGRSVLVFSDGVPVEQEIALKRAAARRRRAGDGPRLRHRDRLRGRRSASPTSSAAGRSAWSPPSGTGAQQVSCLLDAAGVGVSHVLGVGGRDLSEAVGGLATLDALAALDADPATERVLLVSKPPAPSVAGRVREAAGSCRAGPFGGPVAETPDLTAAVEALLGDLGVAVPEWPSAPAPPTRSRRRRAEGLLLRRHARRRDDAARRPGARRHPLQHPAAARARPRHRPAGPRPRGHRLRRRRPDRGPRAPDDRPDAAARGDQQPRRRPRARGAAAGRRPRVRRRPGPGARLVPALPRPRPVPCRWWSR